MSVSLRSVRAFVVLAALGLVALACASERSVRIGTLLEDPGRYEGKTVRVEGEVTEFAGALGYGAYRLDDGTGRIYVVTTRGGAPAEGARVGVVGTFRALYTFGSNSGVAIQEDRRYRP